jgi:PLP dependent protein
MATIGDNLQAVKARIGRAAQAAGRDPVTVILLAVSKSHPAAHVEQACAAGQRAFGENYVQDAVQKMQAVPGLEWHLIGPLQSNKTRLAAERFAWVHTVQSEKIARRLSEQRPAKLAPLNVLIQVKVSGEQTKSGVSIEAVHALACAIGAFPRLNLRGLMAIPEPTGEVALQRARFHQVNELFGKLKGEFAFDTLSMGMSADLEAAIAEGATLVRIGTAIFGARRKEKSAA